MLDIASIMLSTLTMLYVIIRAVQVDKIEPWFPTLTAPKHSDEASGTGASNGGTVSPWRRRF